MVLSNKNLGISKQRRNDEFYTALKDIEDELKDYNFKGLSVYCNCDDYRKSNFTKYFKGIACKNLVSTCYIKDGNGLIEVNGKAGVLKGDGDFRSPECLEWLKKVDVVVTNPPFSLFREFFALMIEHKKKFLLIGNSNVVDCKAIRGEVIAGNVFFGNNFRHDFETSSGIKHLENTCWYTNIPHVDRRPDINTGKFYDNYPEKVIECASINAIPANYDGLIGVPISFITRNNKDFKIVDILSKPFINGKGIYSRLIIQRRKHE